VLNRPFFHYGDKSSATRENRNLSDFALWLDTSTTYRVLNAAGLITRSLHGKSFTQAT